MKKLILAYPADSDSHILYDGNGKLIYGWQEGDDITFVLRALSKHLNIEFETQKVKEVDGYYPDQIKRELH